MIYPLLHDVVLGFLSLDPTSPVSAFVHERYQTFCRQASHTHSIWATSYKVLGKRAGSAMVMRGALMALAALSIQPLVSAQSPPFQNGTAPTETSSLDAQVTDDGVTAGTASTDSASTSEPTPSEALRGGGGYNPDNTCHTTTVTEYCTVTSTVCGKECGKTTYV